MQVTYPDSKKREPINIIGEAPTKNPFIGTLKHPIQKIFYMGEERRDCVHIELIVESPIYSLTMDQVWANYPKIFQHPDGRYFKFIGTQSEKNIVIYHEILSTEKVVYDKFLEWKAVC